jgi:hypothetical protein
VAEKIEKLNVNLKQRVKDATDDGEIWEDEISVLSKQIEYLHIDLKKQIEKNNWL